MYLKAIITLSHRCEFYDSVVLLCDFTQTWLYLTDFSLVKSNNIISVSRLIEGIKVYLWYYNNNNFTRLETVNYLYEDRYCCKNAKVKGIDMSINPSD